MIVADTNLISYLYFDTIHSELANEVHEVDPEWLCPILWRSEFLNVVAGYLRRNLITYQSGLDAVDLAQRAVDGREFTVSQYSVLELLSRSACSSYDCEFVSLAIEFQIHLVTFDKRILKEFPKIALHPHDFIKKYK